jgi:NADPH:quinone reductase-like Zn-dependent oxidoreductase
MNTTNVELEVDRRDLARTRLVERPLPPLANGQVRFAVERFAVTANTVTYAVTGDLLGYWDFFPSIEAGWGRVPAMGWATIVESNHPGVPAGGRYYGWFPMSRYVDVAVSPVGDGLRDEGPHRAAHAPVYRGFTATDRDAMYQAGADAEDRHALLRGLFVTGFLAEDFFADNDWFGARRVLVLSASSKTAIGFAHCAAARGGIEVIGLTSSGNLPFVRHVGCYDEVLTYDELESIPADAAIVAIDMSGNGEILARVHRHFGDALRHSMAIGRSHHESPPAAKDLDGPRPTFFFAPTQVKKRLQDWGPQEYRSRIAAALHGFVDASHSWLEVKRVAGPEAATETWRAAHSGSVSPSVGYVVSLEK